MFISCVMADVDDVNWNPMDWDRAAEELTWERVCFPLIRCYIDALFYHLETMRKRLDTEWSSCHDLL